MPALKSTAKSICASLVERGQWFVGVKKEMSKNKTTFKKGHIVSKEMRQRISLACRGHKLSEETKRKMSESRKGFVFSAETIAKMKKSQCGHKVSELQREHIRKTLTGRKLSRETRLKISNANKGEKGNAWKGGINPVNDTIRKSIQYRLWREAVFARDNFTCQKYGIRGVKLHAHHIQNFAEHPELRFAIDNGITLSEKAHSEFHKEFGKYKNTSGEIKAFISQ
jgi:hypothetical protein